MGLDLKLGLGYRSNLDIVLGWDTYRDGRDAYGHVTSTLREWKRRDWGEGGGESPTTLSVARNPSPAALRASTSPHGRGKARNGAIALVTVVHNTRSS